MHALAQWGRYDSYHPHSRLPSLRTHSTIIPQHFNAVCCVICRLLQWNMSPSLPSSPHSCIILLPISQFDRFSASPLKSDNSQWYPMHMKHNGTSRTHIRLIDGVFPIFALWNLLAEKENNGVGPVSQKMDMSFSTLGRFCPWRSRQNCPSHFLVVYIFKITDTLFGWRG